MSDQPHSKLELTPRRLQVLAGVVLLLVPLQIVGFVRTSQALDDAAAAEWRAASSESRAMNVENRLNSIKTKLNTIEATLLAR